MQRYARGRGGLAGRRQHDAFDGGAAAQRQLDVLHVGASAEFEKERLGREMVACHRRDGHAARGEVEEHERPVVAGNDEPPFETDRERRIGCAHRHRGAGNRLAAVVDDAPAHARGGLEHDAQRRRGRQLDMRDRLRHETLPAHRHVGCRTGRESADSEAAVRTALSLPRLLRRRCEAENGIAAHAGGGGRMDEYGGPGQRLVIAVDDLSLHDRAALERDQAERRRLRRVHFEPRHTLRRVVARRHRQVELPRWEMLEAIAAVRIRNGVERRSLGVVLAAARPLWHRGAARRHEPQLRPGHRRRRRFVDDAAGGALAARKDDAQTAFRRSRRQFLHHE